MVIKRRACGNREIKWPTPFDKMYYLISPYSPAKFMWGDVVNKCLLCPILFDTRIKRQPSWRIEIDYIYPLRWRHNEHDCASNHQPRDCLLNRLFRRRSKKTSKLRTLAFVRGIHRGPVNSPHKWPVTRKMFPFDDVIMPRSRPGWFVRFEIICLIAIMLVTLQSVYNTNQRNRFMFSSKSNQSKYLYWHKKLLESFSIPILNGSFNTIDLEFVGNISFDYYKANSWLI